MCDSDSDKSLRSAKRPRDDDDDGADEHEQPPKKKVRPLAPAHKPPTKWQRWDKMMFAVHNFILSQTMVARYKKEKHGRGVKKQEVIQELLRRNLFNEATEAKAFLEYMHDEGQIFETTDKESIDTVMETFVVLPWEERH